MSTEHFPEPDARRVVATAPQFHDNHIFANTLAFNLLMGRSWPPSQDDIDAAVALCEEVTYVELSDRADFNDRFVEQLALYESAGFETTGMFPVNRDRDTLRAIEFDLMMVGPAGLAERLGVGPEQLAAGTDAARLHAALAAHYEGERFIKVMADNGLTEVARTGIVAIARGAEAA